MSLSPYCEARSKIAAWLCGGLEMAPHLNKWSPADGAHK